MPYVCLNPGGSLIIWELEVAGIYWRYCSAMPVKQPVVAQGDCRCYLVY